MKKDIRVTTQFTSDPTTAIMESDWKSLTVPDQSYTIEQLLERHRQGILTDTGIMREPIYLGDDDAEFDDVDMEKLNHADLTEKAEYAQKITQDLKDAEKADRDEHAKKQSENAQRVSQAEKERKPKQVEKPAEKSSEQED